MSGSLNIYRSRPAHLKYGNFGDELTSAILKKVFRIESKEASMEEAEFIGVGSIIDAWSRASTRRRWGTALRLPRPRLNVWGTGAMLQESAFWWPHKVKVHAVRGHLTAARLNDFKGAIGDPGILAPLLVDAVERTDNVVLIPHFVDEDWVSQRSWPTDWRVAHPDRPLEEVLTKVASARLVISSSLHGLITADAFGIPAVWARTQKSLYKDSVYKFHDHASARGKAFNAPAHYEQLTSSDLAAVATCPDRNMGEWRDELISSFPSDILSQFSDRSAS